MKRTFFILMALLVLSSLFLAACSAAKSAEGEDAPVPAAYAGKKNPLAGNADAITAGKAIYDTNCASCHGAGGKGDGPAGAALTPPPEDLTSVMKEGKADDFLFFRISDGGAMAPYNSSMPAWKGTLSEEQIWQVISYLQATFK